MKIKKIKGNKNIFPVLALVIMLFFAFPQITFFARADELSDMQDEEKSLQKDLAKAEKTFGKLSLQYKQIQNSIAVVQAEIAKTTAKINTAKEQISRKEGDIKQQETRLDFQKKILEDLIRELYYAKKDSAVDIILTANNFSSLISNVDQSITLQEKFLGLIADIKDGKVKLESEKEDLANIKKQQEQLLAVKLDQKQDLVSDKNETAADLADQQKAIDRLKKELSELQGDLAALTGKSYNAKDIREAVEFASKNTGVPEGVLYGFLKKETNLGANTGQCTYDEVEKVSVARYKKYGSKYKASIALLYKRKDIFLSIVKDLGYSKDKKVSCSPSYVGQGGAMGVSQFMSDVWNGYSSQVASQTGHSKPDPWNLTDGVMAMALKLKRAGATSDKESAIRSASINYLGAFNRNYYEGIVYWSKNYKLLFK